MLTGGDYVDRLTNLFKDIAVAVDENEEFVRSTFGQDAVVEAITGLQQVQKGPFVPLLSDE